MCKGRISENTRQTGAVNLDTLAQPVRTFVPGSQVPDNQCDSLDGIRKRARSKWYTQKTVARLVELDTPTLYPDVPNRDAVRKHYARCMGCASTLVREGRTYYAEKYCNGRVCNVCGRIRHARMRNGWEGVASGLQGLTFTTLTRQNVPAHDLRDTIRAMSRECTLIIRNLRHHKGIDANGIRKLEVTYNELRNDFHPHIHIVHDGGPEVGGAIIDEWMRRHPPGVVSREAQDTRPADEDTYAELFKYAAKQWHTGKHEDGSRIRVDVTSLDVMVQALWGLRTFQSFGAIRKALAKVEAQDDEGETLATEGGITIDAHIASKGIPHSSRCGWNGMDWIDHANGQPVTGYKPPPEGIIRYTYSSQPRDGCGGRNLDASVNIEHYVKWMDDEQADINAMPRMRYYVPPPHPDAWKPMDDAPTF